LIRQHVALGGIATWRDAGVIRCGVEEDAPAISCTPELPYTLFGGATFQISNVLAACSVALLMGIKPADIERALLTYDPNPERSPGTMSVLRKRGITVIIDRTDPSWFMRPVLRGIRTMSKGRLFVVTGRLSSVPMGDVPEVGRMLGRDADALILFDHEGDPSHMDSLIQGARRVLDPPLVARYPSKHRAIEAALRRMREGDCLLVLTDKPADALASVRSVNDLAMADQALLEAPMERI
jgi:cyanophycin synthetase